MQQEVFHTDIAFTDIIFTKTTNDVLTLYKFALNNYGHHSVIYTTRLNTYMYTC